MKQISDYREEVLQEMVTNETIDYFDGEFYVSEGIKQQEIREALVRRFSEKLNDALHEPYSKAVINGTATEKVISEYVNDFVDEITDLCEMWGIQFSKECIENKLRESLDSRFKQ